MSIEVVGWFALVATQVFWFPNIARILRTRDVEGYSLAAWFIMLLGLCGWLVYFAAKGDLVGIVANVSGVTGAVITTSCIVYFGRRRVRTPHAKRAAIVSQEPLTTDQG